MKNKWTVLMAGLAATGLLLSACSSASSSSSAPASSAPASVPSSSQASSVADSSMEQPPALESMVYRGKVVSVAEDGSFEVAQLEGFDYGQPSIIFHVDDNTKMLDNTTEITVDGFVEVTFNGILTRSLPPQATAETVTMLMPTAEGMIQNGTIQSVEEVNGTYMVTIVPFTAPNNDMENLVILLVQEDALEHLTVEDLKEGTEVSAVTNGIAAMSLPPQMPVRAIMPFTQAVPVE